jgi:hypothetical protein
VISTSCAAAPAGFLGLGSADVRPYAAVRTTVRPNLQAPVAPVQGTGVPVAGPEVRLRATGLFATGMPTSDFDPIPQNGTTLGIPSSRRPQS